MAESRDSSVQTTGRASTSSSLLLETYEQNLDEASQQIANEFQPESPANSCCGLLQFESEAELEFLSLYDIIMLSHQPCKERVCSRCKDCKEWPRYQHCAHC